MTAERWARVKAIFGHALEIPPAERSAYIEESSEDPEIREEVESLLAAADEAGAFIEQPALAPPAASATEFPAPGDRVGIYSIIQKVGEGGMGSVFQALRDDGEFRRLVAVKILKRGMDTDHVLRRFENEKQILAHFDHPHIAKVLDAGVTPDQRPFFVMEFYAAQPIDTYCHEKRLSIDQRLELFQKVCGAVEYAHRNLIVHRDLKPGNILVTAEGEPRLLDFGIAKVLTDEGKMTRAGVHLMTPEYASPEQIKGDPVNTATDIYSLGVMLYEILTGAHPFPGRRNGTFPLAPADLDQPPRAPSTRVKTHAGRAHDEQAEPPALPGGMSSIQRWSGSLRGDLDNIVLKALDPDVSRRYPSVEQLSADIDRYLHGLPVSAAGDSFLYLMRKFARRNWLAVSSAALVVLALAIGLTVASYQARVARRERARAEQREGEVRQLAQTLIFDLHDAIRNLPGATPVRQELLKKATRALDSLAKGATNSLDLRLELSDAYVRLGSVEGSPSESNLGDSRAALQGYLKAKELLDAIPEKDRNPEVLGRLADVYDRIGEVLRNVGERANGNDHSARSIAFREKAAALQPTSIPAQRSLAIAYFTGSRLAVDTGQYEEAERLAQQALKTFQVVYDSNRASERGRYNLALSLKSLAALRSHAQNPQGALELSKRAIELDKLQVQAKPNDLSAKLDLAIDYSELAEAEAKLGQNEQAVRDYEQSRTLREELLKRDVKNARLKDRTAFINRQEGLLLIDLNRRPEAFKLLQRALALQLELMATSNDVEGRTRLAESRGALGMWYCADGQKAEGLPMLKGAVAEFQAVDQSQQLSSPDQAMRRHLEERLANCSKSGK
ncbi:serine/threonine-protein kinase [Paludibaculum fermentans]|uniref:Protein kinase n=1 Tax=Paludibaculum fermentans TaxID=1473598 RepID=A0A7S7SJN2_PALFE|nr:serine/threonine-protein kinase [Paludibaculum fermentans]QOY87414.1 protein kinase [Paludibaculum fermentans]